LKAIRAEGERVWAERLPANRWQTPGSRLAVLNLDHVLIAVSDLAETAREIEARYGLASIEGGRHPDWGTANRIVPLGQTYLELVAVVDEAKAAESAFGRWVSGMRPKLGRPLGWAVRTHELDTVAGRLGLTVRAGSRATPGGGQLRWRSAGIEQAVAAPSLPFFIDWAQGTPLPGLATANHAVGRVELARLVLVGDADRLADWLGDHELPIVVRAGTPAVASIVLAGAAGEIVLA
jgi:Glyoxalase-like domain